MSTETRQLSKSGQAFVRRLLVDHNTELVAAVQLLLADAGLDGPGWQLDIQTLEWRRSAVDPEPETPERK